MSFPILLTKLFIPATRPELVARSRLIGQLNQDLNRKLTLISAPAELRTPSRYLALLFNGMRIVPPTKFCVPQGDLLLILPLRPVTAQLR